MQSMDSLRVECTGVLNENDAETIDGGLDKNIVELKHANDRDYKLLWHIIIFIVYAHLGAVYGIFLMITSARIYTTIFAFTMFLACGFGITAGAHRLWSHRSYKATLPLKILLMIFHTAAFQLSIIAWARDHRLHHKYSETDADPYNAKRGFFFSHIGWIMCKEHPAVTAKERTIDMSDLRNDGVLRFQNTFYPALVPVICVILPLIIPYYLWNETIENTWYIALMFRWTFQIHVTGMVNSVLHLYGNHPYDKFINPTENGSLAVITLGEGFHNYHHVFPWDYKAAELGNYGTNLTTFLIDCMAKIGWAYDLKTVAPEMIKRRTERTGDGTHYASG